MWSSHLTAPQMRSCWFYDCHHHLSLRFTQSRRDPRATSPCYANARGPSWVMRVSCDTHQDIHSLQRLELSDATACVRSNTRDGRTHAPLETVQNKSPPFTAFVGCLTFFEAIAVVFQLLHPSTTQPDRVCSKAEDTRQQSGLRGREPMIFSHSYPHTKSVSERAFQLPLPWAFLGDFSTNNPGVCPWRGELGGVK